MKEDTRLAFVPRAQQHNERTCSGSFHGEHGEKPESTTAGSPVSPTEPTAKQEPTMVQLRETRLRCAKSTTLFQQEKCPRLGQIICMIYPHMMI